MTTFHDAYSHRARHLEEDSYIRTGTRVFADYMRHIHSGSKSSFSAHVPGAAKISQPDHNIIILSSALEMGFLVVETDPKDCAIEENEEFVNYSFKVTAMTPGKHTITVSDGSKYQEREVTVTIVGGKTTTEKVTLDPVKE